MIHDATKYEKPLSGDRSRTGLDPGLTHLWDNLALCATTEAMLFRFVEISSPGLFLCPVTPPPPPPPKKLWFPMKQYISQRSVDPVFRNM